MTLGGFDRIIILNIKLSNLLFIVDVLFHKGKYLNDTEASYLIIEFVIDLFVHHGQDTG